MSVTASSVTRNVTSGWEEPEKKANQTQVHILYHTQIKLLHSYDTSFAIKFMKAN